MQQVVTTPIYARIEAHIRQEIATGNLRTGERLPSEARLAVQFSTTRSTVTKALQRLVFEGLIVRRTGSGSFVASANLSAVIDSARVRTFEEQLGKTDGEVTYKLMTWEVRPATKAEVERLRLRSTTEVFHLERLRLVDGQVIGIEIRIIPTELGCRFTVEMMSGKSIYRILSEELGRPVVGVTGQIRAALASSRQAQQLSIRRGAAVLIREYTLLGQGGEPLIHGISYYRDDFRIDYAIRDAGNYA